MQTASKDLYKSLSLRQKQILSLYAQGLDGREIARELNITYGTVRTHIKIILGNLKANSIEQAVALFVFVTLHKDGECLHGLK